MAEDIVEDIPIIDAWAGACCVQNTEQISGPGVV